MSYKTTPRPVQQASTKPLTEEEKKFQVMRFLSQRREQFAISILCSLLQKNPGVKNEDVIIKAVDIADQLLEKLYPMTDGEVRETPEK